MDTCDKCQKPVAERHAQGSQLVCAPCWIDHDRAVRVLEHCHVIIEALVAEVAWSMDDDDYLRHGSISLHQECGEVFFGEGTCPQCFNSECDRCFRQHWNEGVASGDPEDNNPLCDECWDEVMVG